MTSWETLLTTAHETIPPDEWWYGLPPGLSNDDYTRRIKDAEKTFQTRYGYPPDAIPRVVYVGNTPVLAYPCPEQSYSILDALPEPIPTPEESPQLMLWEDLA